MAENEVMTAVNQPTLEVKICLSVFNGHLIQCHSFRYLSPKMDGLFVVVDHLLFGAGRSY